MTKVSRGQVYYVDDMLITVTRVAEDQTWADIHVHQESTQGEWDKRQPLPFPLNWTRWNHDPVISRETLVAGRRAQRDERRVIVGPVQVCSVAVRHDSITFFDEAGTPLFLIDHPHYPGAGLGLEIADNVGVTES